MTLAGTSISAGQVLLLIAFTLLVRALAALGERWVTRRSPPVSGKEPVLAGMARSALRISGWVMGFAGGLAVARIILLDVLAAYVWHMFNTPLFPIGETNISLATLIAVAAIVVGSYWASAFMRERLREGAERHLTDEDRRGRFAIIDRLVHYVVLMSGVGIALHTAGINLSGLFAAGAVFAVGIGFAMQNIAQNFVSGVIVLIERAIKPGDILVVEGQVVKVQRMGIRSTVVRTRDNEDLIVPNGTLAQSTVANLTLLDRVHRVRVPVGVAYSSDLDKVFAVLKRLAETFEPRDPGHPPRILLTGFGASSIDFEVSVWTSHPWVEPTLASDLRHAIWRAFRDEGIVIAFPQLDVHLDPEVVQAMGGKS